MDSTTGGTPRSCRGAAITFVTLGTAAIVFAGLFSAATARSATYHSAWLVAYLVLVVGIAQVAFGLGQWWLASRQLSVAHVASELVIFNVGNAGVIVGTLLSAPLWVDVGSALLVIALAIFGWAVWAPRRCGVALVAYWALIVVLGVSVVVGIYFAHFTAR